MRQIGSVEYCSDGLGQIWRAVASELVANPCGISWIDQNIASVDDNTPYFGIGYTTKSGAEQYVVAPRYVADYARQLHSAVQLGTLAGAYTAAS